jgi:hypothetical protein
VQRGTPVWKQHSAAVNVCGERFIDVVRCELGAEDMDADFRAMSE